MFRAATLSKATRKAAAVSNGSIRTTVARNINTPSPVSSSFLSSWIPAIMTQSPTDSARVVSTSQRRVFSSGPPPPGGPQNLGSIFGTSPKSGSFLQDFTVDLTELARQQHGKDNKMDPIIGRHEEIRRCLQILARRTKNNPVLIGQAGVGKSKWFER
jgi:ATP-dependent Clp protease ATP-binding subunit ClpA